MKRLVFDLLSRTHKFSKNNYRRFVSKRVTNIQQLFPFVNYQFKLFSKNISSCYIEELII